MKDWKNLAFYMVISLVMVGLSAGVWSLVLSFAEMVRSSEHDCRSQVMVMAVTEHSKSAWTGCEVNKTLTVETLPDGSSVLVQCLCPTGGTP
jgi:hypothetical protein